MDEHDEVTGRRFRDQPMWKQVTAAVLAGIILAGLAALAHSVRHTQKVTTMGASVGSSASSTRSLMASSSTTSTHSGGVRPGCTLTIGDPFAQIQATPGYPPESGDKVPPGTYAAITSELLNWAGQETRWYEIAVGGQSGWIPDDGILVDSKSSACPLS